MPSDKNDYISNISYINKDFETLWEEILTTVPKLTNKWLPSEANESDPLVVLLKELAIVSDKINFNIDKNILELFPQTLTQLRSAMNVYESLGYTPDWYVSANLDLTFTRIDTSKTGTIKRFTAFSDENTEIIYTLLQDVTFKEAKDVSLTGRAIEGSMQDFKINGGQVITLNNLDTRNRIYFTERNVAQNGIFISNNKEFSDLDITAIQIDKESVWSRVDNLAQYRRGSKVFKFGIDAATNTLYLQFPEDIGDLIGDGLYIKYVLSAGEAGNIKRGTITRLLNKSSTSEDTDAFKYNVTNTTSSQNGKDPMTIAEMQKQFERVVGTFNTLVTLLDYEDYIYEYKTSLGNNIVSNIRMSDRTNDPEYSVNVVSMTVDGNTELNTVTLNNTAGKTAMSAFDIKAYALRPIQSVNTQNDLNVSFEVVDSSQEKDNITKSIATAKHIEHDLYIDGHPWVVPYDLSGQIYLKGRVSSIEASNIKYNVDTTLYKKLQSRNITWGEVIDYQEIIDTIKGADDRIAYVALMPIQYDNAELVGGTSYSGPSLEVRNVLCGNAPFTTFSSFIYPYGATDTAELSNIEIIRPEVNVIGNTGSYTVQSGETFSILLPKYKTDIQYTNYLYYSTKNIGAAIQPGQLYKLKDEEKIQIFEDNDTNAGVKATIQRDSIIKTDFTLEPTTGTTKNELRTNSIYVVSLAETALNDGNGGPIKILTNSAGLREAFSKGNDTKYTLKRGEYFVYTNKSSTTLAFLGEGTTLWAKSVIDIDENKLATNITDLLAAGDPTLANGKYTEVGADVIQVQINDIWNFGSGAIIKATGSNLFPATTGVIESVWELTNVTGITYKTSEKEDETSISKLAGDKYQAYLSLALNLPDTGSTQVITGNAYVKQQIAYKAVGETSEHIIASGTTIQSSLPLTIDGVEYNFGTGSTLSLLKYKAGTGTLEVTAGSFKQTTGATAIPGTTGNYCIVPFRTDGNVQFKLYEAGKTIPSGSFIGAPAFIDSGTTATYYKWEGGTGSMDTLASTLTDNLLAVYSTGSLGGVQYDYTYRPTANQELKDPSRGENYFSSNHPYNKFTIAKLRSLSELKISTSSIK